MSFNECRTGTMYTYVNTNQDKTSILRIEKNQYIGKNYNIYKQIFMLFHGNHAIHLKRLLKKELNTENSMLN